MKRLKVLAMYLPQFHRLPENDEWWGKGFTEWTIEKLLKGCLKTIIRLEKPAENLLRKDIHMSFCFCWANETWREPEVILAIPMHGRKSLKKGKLEGGSSSGVKLWRTDRLGKTF